MPGYEPEKGITFNINQPVSAAEIAQQLGLPLAEIKFIMLNGHSNALEAIVQPNDRLAFFPAVGGG